MSLDITLKAKDSHKERCDHCDQRYDVYESHYEASITHNLGKMASEAGIYEHLWHPEGLNITRAGDLIEPITKGLQDMKDSPDHYKQFNPKNGWGDYAGFVNWIERYLNALKEYPDAVVETST